MFSAVRKLQRQKTRLPSLMKSIEITRASQQLGRTAQKLSAVASSSIDSLVPVTDKLSNSSRKQKIYKGSGKLCSASWSFCCSVPELVVPAQCTLFGPELEVTITALLRMWWLRIPFGLTPCDSESRMTLRSATMAQSGRRGRGHFENWLWVTILPTYTETSSIIICYSLIRV